MQNIAPTVRVLLARNVFNSNVSKVTSIINLQRRNKHKGKWASKEAELQDTQRALNYFDSFYKPVYGSEWPSLRVALLSQQKYSALLNNFAETEDIIVDLITCGADDITRMATLKIAELDTENTTEELEIAHEVQIAAVNMKDAMKAGIPKDEESLEEPDNIVGSSGLYDFMPATRRITEKEKLATKEIDQGFYVDEDIFEVKKIPSQPLTIPYHLKVYAKERGDVTRFPAPKRDASSKIEYYLFDAASILPVLALDLAPGENVLDLCAAPGGKSLAILQTMLPDSLICVDKSFSRLDRLKSVLKNYLPKAYTEEKKVQTVQMDGVHFCRRVEADVSFDKILVDVPCYTDRHVLSEEDNNLFRKSRQKERLMIQETQKDLLVGALRLLKPGGQAVYSTCTLSAPQNDGIVQQALEELWETSEAEYAIMDSSELVHKFSDFMNFHQGCRYGQLVVPNLTANFGPMYFCKIKRVS